MRQLVEEERVAKVGFVARRVPPDLRDRVAAAVADCSEGRDCWWDIVSAPFARWAPPVADDHVFPRALLEFLLDPPRDYWPGHTCGRCGLRVPLLWTFSNDPDPPADLTVFPACPACGWKTSYAAYSGPDREDGSPFLVCGPG